MNADFEQRDGNGKLKKETLENEWKIHGKIFAKSVGALWEVFLFVIKSHACCKANCDGVWNASTECRYVFSAATMDTHS